MKKPARHDRAREMRDVLLSPRPRKLWLQGQIQTLRRKTGKLPAGHTIMRVPASIPRCESNLCRGVMSAIDIFHRADYWRRLRRTIFWRPLAVPEHVDSRAAHIEETNADRIARFSHAVV